MNKTVNTVIWVALFIFLLPSSLAVASWNSLPGTRLFTTKLFMEQALVTLIPSASAKGNLQIAYTERRLEDAKKIIEDDSSGRGLAYLDTQINTTRQTIVMTSDRDVKRQLSLRYIATLRQANAKLEEKKQLAQSSQPRIIVQQQTVVVYQIIQTQQTITETIQQIQAETPPSEPTPTPI